MAAPLIEIIDKIADDADDLLADAANRAQAKAVVEEVLSSQHPKLSPADRAKVVSGVIAILEKEGFFEGSGGDNIWDEEVAGEGG